MQLAVLSWLSEPQNRLFNRRLAHAAKEIGLAATEATDPEAADLAYLCGLPASRMLSTHFPLLAPVLPGDRSQHQPWYFVDVLSRNEERGLGAGRWAYNQTSSFSGWIAVRHGLRLHHIDPDQLRWVETGSHASSLAALRNGTADLAGIDSVMLDLAPQLAEDLTVIDSWGPWPTPPVMAARSLDPGLVSELASAFLEADEAITWVALDPGHLEAIQVVAGSTATSGG
ncbi:MAG TPA: PhnD/SsuA/transferrin family substrate-binding protein [Acidimicrobiia bacterium]|nr:PhnD/SsuA/transferrin family substrate-binding protein [Acidimicrobiia bacterium]